MVSIVAKRALIFIDEPPAGLYRKSHARKENKFKLPAPPSPRLLEVYNALKDGYEKDPAKDAVVSVHATFNACRQVRSRWQRRWKLQKLDDKILCYILELYPGTEKPWALLMRYRPPAEVNEDSNADGSGQPASA